MGLISVSSFDVKELTFAEANTGLASVDAGTVSKDSESEFSRFACVEIVEIWDIYFTAPFIQRDKKDSVELVIKSRASLSKDTGYVMNDQ